MLHDSYLQASTQQQSIESVLEGVATDIELAELTRVNIGAADLMIDRVVESAQRRRSMESEIWA